MPRLRAARNEVRQLVADDEADLVAVRRAIAKSEEEGVKAS